MSPKKEKGFTLVSHNIGRTLGPKFKNHKDTKTSVLRSTPIKFILQVALSSKSILETGDWKKHIKLERNQHDLLLICNAKRTLNMYAWRRARVSTCTDCFGRLQSWKCPSTNPSAFLKSVLKPDLYKCWYTAFCVWELYKLAQLTDFYFSPHTRLIAHYSLSDDTWNWTTYAMHGFLTTPQ